jgi:hypothetical protein
MPFRIGSMGRKVVCNGVSGLLLSILMLGPHTRAGPLRKVSNSVVQYKVAIVDRRQRELFDRIVPMPLIVQGVEIAACAPAAA